MSLMYSQLCALGGILPRGVVCVCVCVMCVCVCVCVRVCITCVITEGV